MTIVLMIIICILLICLIYLLRKQRSIIVHNESDILKGMELERRKREYREYLDSYYYNTIPPPSVRDGYKKIEKEVLGHYLNKN